MDRADSISQTPWPQETLRLPKSLFVVVSTETEPFSLDLLMPIDFDKVQMPAIEVHPDKPEAIKKALGSLPTIRDA